MEEMDFYEMADKKTLDRFVSGRDPASRRAKGAMTPHNEFFLFELFGLKRALLSATWLMLVFDRAAGFMARANGLDIGERKTKMRVEARVLAGRRESARQIYEAVKAYPVAGKRAAGAIRREIQAQRDALEAFEKETMPFYLAYCGLDGFARGLESQGSRMLWDVREHFLGGKEPGGRQALLGSMPCDLALEYYLKAAEATGDRAGCERRLRESVKADAAAEAALRREREEKESEERRMKGLDKASKRVDDVAAKIQNVCDTNMTFREWKLCISKLQVRRAAELAAKEGDKGFSMILCGKSENAGASVRFATLDGEGGVGLSPDWSFKSGTKFVGKLKEKAGEFAQRLREQNPEMVVRVVDFATSA